MGDGGGMDVSIGNIKLWSCIRQHDAIQLG
jgi:hypothetical protein